ncbi:sensor domain-containing diguanylate cyclase [Acinetobacter sp. ANC 4216]|uniref:diguanylate cyclase n=1 Tax=Acinetobacter kookii TaxID=1226327 RepID=A0A1G6GU99_9GAMM|nr:MULTISPECIES: sensor domain-containing diguanylate cyclase [Acinetobacter]MCT8089522.1 sensor domain-containing diguanylate cyclase [Acinetobacter sp. F_3_1]MCT8098241.1 sensor domain-containing diguanylate cyclase [Acinetobacter sp. C_3_1]MCT8101156.1 sensor domain-containing diguanylate cyclase [Acinetobacter sp. C_4_1]MCT8135144.1 sensor domain-containing diguanylate cyclase [Acinetobacter sp. T_3_1]TCB72791.1 sensor domain-containing diguanylate cyclase [Acinetobacter sp. ANC 4216]
MDHINFRSFQEAGQAVLKFLHSRFGFNLWMITRVEGKDWIVLQSEDHGYDVQPGQVFQWADSFCFHMIAGKGPKIAPRSEDIPLYATAPINQQVNIKSYIGQPLIHEDGSLFGTLCAIDPQIKSDAIMQEVELVELFGNLLSNILQAELRQNEQIRQHERLEAEALRDGLTGLYNRRAWEKLVTTEEERCKRYGHPAAVFFIDLNDLKKVNDSLGHDRGDELIQQTANVLRNTARSNDIVARLGGDEFVILSLENDEAGAEVLLSRLMQALKQEKIAAAIGVAMRHPAQGLFKAAAEADRRMFEHKRQLKSEA